MPPALAMGALLRAAGVAPFRGSLRSVLRTASFSPWNIRYAIPQAKVGALQAACAGRTPWRGGQNAELNRLHHLLLALHRNG